ncbi:MAG TPA: PhzF family phenazine biosynthesis protein [Cellvibrio sp.]|nr:PhzF family phenazine biosynthesis protein [Cellvibrio sp.]
MKLNLYIVDAFTTKQFSGNQAAVVLLDTWLSIEIMQNIASENNLSETAFVVRNSSGIYEIRWFSPLKEIDFCGHATLASAFIIFSKHTALPEITFWAKAVGNLIVKRKENSLIEMTFPNREPIEIIEIPQALKEGLSISPAAYLKNQQAYFAIMENEEQVRLMVPDLEKLKTLGPLDVVVTAKSKEFDFASRYFWPANGGTEDPVTGSIHAGLAPYWARQLNKRELVALQASTRSGVLYCRVEESTVFVSGYCISYLEGTISI